MNPKKKPLYKSEGSKAGAETIQMLTTEFGENLPDVPWNVYPRPQLRRKDWLCLNGDWELKYTAEGHPCRCTVKVPFCPESLLSGVSVIPPYGSEMEYSRVFTILDSWKGKRVILHFGAVSRIVVIKINGRIVGRNEESYLPFSIDITDSIRQGENELSVSVVNDISHAHQWGKQKVNRGGMWYTPVSGIWQTVWIEPVPEKYIESIDIRTGMDFAEICVSGIEEGTVLLEGREFPLSDGKVRIPVENPVLWSPDNPHLYDFSLKCGEDIICSYFALRTISVENVGGYQRICLNGKPYFFNGLLDQGYWSDGLYTPASPECYPADILAAKSFGFNTLRKHIKIEPEQFYYDCDRLGMIVFQDMVNCGEYSFIRDTALPTVGIQSLNDRRLHPDREMRENFIRCMEKTVSCLGNHPSICYWTIFNEGWGQFCADEMYDKLKKIDNTRLVDSTSGWFRRKKSDVESLHIYFKPLHLGKSGRAQIISEFGGYSYKLPEHSFNLSQTYGYRKYNDGESYAAAMRKLYESALRLVDKGLCGTICTQLSDVEDETNGLLTYDRKEKKLSDDTLTDIFEKLQEQIEPK